MVKTRGSALSIDATGTLADTVSFGSWKGRTYLRKKAVPQQPNSPQQITFRAAFQYITQTWPRMTTVQKNRWTDLGTAQNVTPFDAYVAENMERWRRREFPTRYWPPTGPASEMTFAGGYPNAVAAENSAHLQIKLSANVIIDKAAIFRDTSPNPPIQRDLLIHFIPINMLNLAQYYDRGLAPGAYYYRFQCTRNWGGIHSGAFAGPVNIS